MTTTIGSLDLNAFSDLYSDSNQYFWFESNSSATYGAGVHVTLVPDTTFISNPTGQNILMNTDGLSIRNGLLPMMTLDNNSLDFNVVDTTAGTYTTTATFTATGAQIGQNGGAHSVIDADGQRFYASNGTTQLANIGYGEVQTQSGTATAPYYTFGVRKIITTAYSPSSTYDVGDMRAYDDKVYVCVQDITTPEPWNAEHWRYYIGDYSIVEGLYTTASGYYSHAEGWDTTAIGGYSHVEGYETVASGGATHAEGSVTTASGASSHSEGASTIASGDYSHAEGLRIISSVASGASGEASHSEGYNTTASGKYSHAQNNSTIAAKEAQTAIGKFNTEDTEATPSNQKAFIIGNGTSNSARSDALTVDWNGNVVASGDITDGNGNVLSEVAEVETHTFTPTVGQSYATYGGCSYSKVGSVVYVHIGMSGLTGGTSSTVYTLPQGYRPIARVDVIGTGSTVDNFARMSIFQSGSISVRPIGSGNSYATISTCYIAAEAE